MSHWKLTQQRLWLIFLYTHTHDKKQTAYNILSSIAAHLCKCILNIPSDVVSLHKDNVTSSVLSSTEHYQMYALDKVLFPERDPLLSVLRELVGHSDSSKPNLLVNSRREPYLEAGIGRLGFEEICLTAPGADEGIKLDASDTFAGESRFSQWSDTLRMEIIDILAAIEHALSDYVWWRVKEKHSKAAYPCDARDALYSLPETLDETYRLILLGVQKKYRSKTPGMGGVHK
ncbi:hypothetical protein M422DRAFT_259525 [Sphaerobolus stellatus SS14]|uniref:Uncharacterized protein n=1 Tax=Sphaerobolus stellatus (strain SS14) TaxID=990650 RepID=A0A0C9VJT8_SPHS4|nr:hypothetical protein M422DRAFT_259525 [Sphaerobolus stellatus SS14]